jgi:hypothetical protein
MTLTMITGQLMTDSKWRQNLTWPFGSNEQKTEDK